MYYNLYYIPDNIIHNGLHKVCCHCEIESFEIRLQYRLNRIRKSLEQKIIENANQENNKLGGATIGNSRVRRVKLRQKQYNAESLIRKMLRKISESQQKKATVSI